MLVSIMLFLTGLQYIVAPWHGLWPLCIQIVRFLNILGAMTLYADGVADRVVHIIFLAYKKKNRSNLKMTNIPDALIKNLN